MPSRMLVKNACVLLLLLLPAPAAWSQQMEPRAYSNAPVGMNFLIAGYTYSSGGYSADPSLPLTNANLKLEAPVLAYGRVFDAWGKSAKFDVVAAGGCISGDADYAGTPVSRDVCGMLDPAARISVNLFGAPAMGLEEFRSYRQNTIMGVSLQVQAPLGQYDPTRVVNLGNNRWAFRPEIGVSKAFNALTIEMALGASLFTANGNFYGGKRREQDPIYNVQLHLIYELGGGTWIALDGTYFAGGRTAVDDVKGNDELSSSRAGLTLALPVDRNNSVKLYASRGISVRTGSDYDLFGVAWQYRWGGGL